jgi:hypothetical protein
MKSPSSYIVSHVPERLSMADDITQKSTRPKKSLLQKDVGDAFLEIVGKAFTFPEKPKQEKLAQLTVEQRLQLQQIEEDAIAEFSGQLDELESALGMLRMGHHLGWKVLYLIHSKRTIRKYEEILNIKIRELFPEVGPSSYRSYGFAVSEKLSNFWKIVSGDTKIPDRRKIEK